MWSRGSVARALGRAALAAICLLAALPIAPQAWAQNTYTVTTGGDDSGIVPCTGGGTSFSCTTLRDAITTANGAGGTNTINFASTVTSVTLTANLNTINTSASTSTTINGGTSNTGTVTIDGAGHTVFFVTTAAAKFVDLTVFAAAAAGGAGSASGGGGGLGAGAGLFVASGAAVTTSNVTFFGDTATGGAGATGSASTAGGNGGGLNGGGGGGGGSLSGAGGSGGFGGGGGGGNGGAGGAGGFGGGGGGGTAGGVAGFAGGNGGGSSQNGGGGGGGALGGAIMVGPGGMLETDDTLAINSNSVTPGAGGTGGQNGSSGGAFGAGIFLAGTGTLDLAPSGGLTQTISNSIADQSGSGGTGTNAGSWGITKLGAGTVVLGGANAYTGGTTVDAGTLSVSADNNLGAPSNAVSLANGTTLTFTGSFTFDHPVTISGDPTFDVAPGDTVTVSVPIADGISPGTLVKTDAGTLVLSAVNTYTGATTVSGGTLALSGAGSIASSSGLNLASALTTFDISGSTASPTILGLTGVFGSTVSLGANTLIVNQAGSSTFAGTIADGGLHGGTGGSLNKEGAGTLTLSGTNTYTGATTIGGGTLALSGFGSIQSSSGVNLTASGTTFDVSGTFGSTFINGLSGVAGSTVSLGSKELIVAPSGSQTFAGVVTGTSASTLDFNGTGTETLTGVSTATGTLVIADGTLLVGNGGSVASFTGLNLDSSAAVFDISGGGNQTVQNLSSVFGGSVMLGANTLTDSTNGTGSFFAGVISGTGGLTVSGSSSLTLSGTNTYTGATTISSGTLTIDNGSIAQSSGVNLTASGATFALTGNEAVTIKDLSGVSGSQVSTGSNTLLFGTGNSTSFAGSFSGFGELFKQGAGALFLTGNSSNFNGTTVISAGGVDIAPTAGSGGSLGGSVTVENGAFLIGHGTIGGTVTNVSGIVASLGAANPLSVGGSYIQNSGGTLLVGLSPIAATRLAVTGGATLSGTLNVQAVPGNIGYVPFTSYTILNTTAGNVSGAFTQLTGVLPVLPLTIEYLPKAVDLVLGGFAGVTGNEQAVAKVLNGAFSTATGEFANVLITGINLPPAEMQQALSSFGGQIYGNLAEVSLQDRRLFLGAMDARMRLFSDDSPSAAVFGSLGGSIPLAWGSGPNALQLAALSDAIDDPVGLAVRDQATDAVPPPAAAPAPTPLYAPAPQSYAPPPAAPPAAPAGGIDDPVGVAASQMPAAPLVSAWMPSSGNLWARGFGQFGSIYDGGGALGSNYTTGGGAIGADLIHTPERVVGIAAGGGQSNVSLSTNPETGTITFFQFGAYGAQAIGDGFAVDGAAIYSHDSYDVTRGIFLPGSNRVATSSHGGDDGVLDVGMSKAYIASGWVVTPRAGLSYYHIGQSSFSESGANILDLAVNPNSLDALFSRIGIAFARPVTLGEMRLVPEFRGVWLHNFLDVSSTYNATFIGGNAASFAQSGVPIGRDSGDIGVGLGFALPQAAFPGELSGFIQYDASLAMHEFANSIAAGVRYKW